MRAAPFRHGESPPGDTNMPETKPKNASSSTTFGEFALILGVAVAVAFGMSLWMRRSAPVSDIGGRSTIGSIGLPSCT